MSKTVRKNVTVREHYIFYYIFNSSSELKCLKPTQIYLIYIFIENNRLLIFKLALSSEPDFSNHNFFLDFVKNKFIEI